MRKYRFVVLAVRGESGHHVWDDAQAFADSVSGSHRTKWVLTCQKFEACAASTPRVLPGVLRIPFTTASVAERTITIALFRLLGCRLGNWEALIGEYARFLWRDYRQRLNL